MALYITLQFINNEILLLSTSSFLFKRSKFLPLFEVAPASLVQSFDIEEDNTIPILCSKTYVTENETYLFDDKTNLSFMFTLQPNKFLDVCKFLDIICYENEDTLFSDNFIKYVMTNTKEEINIIKYFMQPEIRSIMNYINKEDINIQIRTCTLEFYALYLTEYKEDVIKHNRIDLFESVQNKDEYYRYIHKYNNQLTYMVKETLEYNNYIINISNELIEKCKKNNLNSITFLIENGANINFQNNNGFTPLQFTNIIYNIHHTTTLKVIQYLVEHGALINLQNIDGNTALHFASQRYNNLNNIQYLVEHGANINLQNNNGETALHFASKRYNNLNVIQYLVENGANIYLQNNNGYTALHFASKRYNNLKVIQYLVEHNANINLQNNFGSTALYFASQFNNNLEVIQYLVEHSANVNLQNNNGYTTLDITLQYKKMIRLIILLIIYKVLRKNKY